MGRALAQECQHYNVQVLLGPGVNLKRDPRGGRNHEYFSEDPCLAGHLAQAYIGGVQESGQVGACLKHFCLNNQESNRFVVDVIVDERTMRELYLPAFEQSLCGNSSTTSTTVQNSIPKLVMGAYNKVNGVYCCEHEYLLGDILRGEYRYNGVVVSDWGAVLDRTASLRAGMDLEMPGSPTKGAFDREVLEACATERSLQTSNSDTADEEQPMVPSAADRNSNGPLETAIDACAQRVVRLISDLQPGDTGLLPSANEHKDDLFDTNDRLAREIARECIVLLQNRDDFLPLSRSKVFGTSGNNSTINPKIGIVGGFAKDSPRYQGMGSAHVTPTKVTTFYDAMTLELASARDSNSVSNHVPIPFAQGYDPDAEGDEIQQTLIDEAVSIAQRPELDVLVVCVGLPEIAESEGFDRPHTRLPRQHIALVEALSQVHPNLVVVLSNGGIVEIPQSFVDGTQAILDGFLLGQAGGLALADVLLGDVSPSGKLPESIPLHPDLEVPSANYFPGTQHRVEYREGLDVGYRYYDTAGIPVRFPFGHGLHYTTFAYTNLRVAVERDETHSKRVTVSLDVTNTGKTFSKPVREVVQLYVRPIGSKVYRPYHELKAFSKRSIAPGTTETVEFVLNERAFSFYDIGRKDWVVEDLPEGFEVRVGASSRDVRLTQILHFSTGLQASELAQESYPPLDRSLESTANRRVVVDDETFAKRFGPAASTVGLASGNGTSPAAEEPPREQSVNRNNNNNDKVNSGTLPAITRNTLVVDAARLSRIASVIMFVSWMVAKQEVKEGPSKKRELRMIRANLENVPLRSLVVFSQGALTFKTLDVLIHLMNGEYKKALGRVFGRTKKSRE